MFLRILLLLIGVYACSTSVIMIKACAVDPVLLASYRLVVAAVVLAPLYFRDLRRFRGEYTMCHLGRSVLPGALIGVHFILWIMGARLAASAVGTLIVTMVPITTPFFLYFIAHERINRGEWIGTAIAIVGVAVMGAADLHYSMDSFWGDVLCFLSMLLLAAYLVLGKKNRGFPSFWLYVVPLYLVGGLTCFAIGVFSAGSLEVGGTQDILMILGLGIVPTVVGHSILNYLMGRMRGQVVSIACLGQFIFAGIMAYFWLGEIPDALFYPSSALVLIGSIMALLATPQSTVQGK